MPDHAFLTDTRREVIHGQYSGSDGARRGVKSQVRQQSRAAIEELTEVAESPVIDTTEVFDPDEVFKLLRAILSPSPPEWDTDDPHGLLGPEDYTDEFRAHSDRMYVQMDKLMRDYRREPKHKADDE